MFFTKHWNMVSTWNSGSEIFKPVGLENKITRNKTDWSFKCKKFLSHGPSSKKYGIFATKLINAQPFITTMFNRRISSVFYMISEN